MEKFDTFISYNSNDFDLVEGFYRTLKIAGIKVFFDKYEINTTTFITHPIHRV